MEERRQLILKVSKQLMSLSNFVEAIERSLSIAIGLDKLEPQIKTVLDTIEQSHKIFTALHNESLIPAASDESAKDAVRKENHKLKEKIHKLIEENKRLKSQDKSEKSSDD